MFIIKVNIYMVYILPRYLILEKCEKPVEESAQCERNDLIIAEQLCSKLKTDFTFQPCRQVRLFLEML